MGDNREVLPWVGRIRQNKKPVNMRGIRGQSDVFSCILLSVANILWSDQLVWFVAMWATESPCCIVIHDPVFQVMLLLLNNKIHLLQVNGLFYVVFTINNSANYICQVVLKRNIYYMRVCLTALFVLFKPLHAFHQCFCQVMIINKSGNSFSHQSYT